MIRNRKSTWSVCLLALLMSGPVALSATWYVDDDAVAGGDGTSWGTAFTTIQAGIDAAANGDTVLVADGIYEGDGNIEIRFNGKAITVASQNGPENCIVRVNIWKRSQESKWDNYSLFWFDSGETADSILEGFTLLGENLDPTVSITSSSPVIRNCLLDNNMDMVALSIGSGSSALVEDCVFTGQSLMRLYHCTAHIRGCIFHGSEVDYYVPIPVYSSSVTFENTVIHGCHRINGSDCGGAIQSWNSVISMIGCKIYDNGVFANIRSSESSRINEYRYSGGAIYLNAGELTLINCLLYENFVRYDWYAEDDVANGGAIYNAGGVVTAINNTFAKNSADYNGESTYGIHVGCGGVITSSGDAEVFLYNNIIWGNYSFRCGHVSGGVIHEYSSGYSSVVSPPFVDWENGNYRLVPGADFINAGYNALVPAEITVDLDGRPRIYDARVDQGAYEYNPTPFCGDEECSSEENPCDCPEDCGPPPTEELNCVDGLDNDCDGLIDEDDPECDQYCGDTVCSPGENQCNCPADCGTPPAIEDNCSDAFDNDCDGMTDMDDPNCITCGDAICSAGENQCNCPADCGMPPTTEAECSDGLDNDCDGLIDKHDDDCWICGNHYCDPNEDTCSCSYDCGNPLPAEESCRDGGDDDCDGLIDMDDPDCQLCGDGICSPGESASTCPMDCDPTTIIFVDDNAPSGGDGSSWATAYTDLVSALENAASGDTIWVAAGTYSAGEAYYHTMVDGVSLFGGFAGTEVPGSFHLADRDFEINPSTLSGRSFSAYANNLSESIIIDGFALRRIIRIVGSDLTVRNITAVNGGSLVSCEDSTVTVENAVANPGGGFTIYNSTVDVKNCDVGGYCAKVRDSTVRMVNIRMHDSYRPDWNGGAMEIRQSDITLLNAAIYNNKVDGHKGMGGSGGGICITDGSLTIKNSLFVNNEAHDYGGVTANGGAIAAFGDVEINVSASIFSGNEADDEGDDIWQENKASNWSQLKNRYPTFVNPEEGNFYLLPTSSYIDLGSSTTPEPDMSLDLIQNPRKVGKRVDYGPIEFHGRPFCGNGLCDEYETPCTCPGDCGEPEGTESLCQNGLDDDCDGLVDADDEDCLLCGDSICSSEEDQCGCPQDCGVPPLVETNCSDGFDDDCDRLIDRLDPDCLICGDGFCTYNEDSCSCPGDCGYPFSIELECSDGFDNDCDGLIDALDPDCPDCGNSVCESGENSCNCPEDCGVPPTTEVECSDSIDNDCDGLVDIQDPDCPGCGNSVCEEDENSCSCPNDCGEPAEAELVCNDGIDDDCDGLVDIQDPDCPGCGNSVCEEDENSCTCPNDCGEPAEIELVCDDGIDDDCDGLVDTMDPDCCGNGICEAGENSCVCSEDCGDPSDIELVCDDGFDDDCDGLIDALDPDCSTCGNGICEAREDSCSCSEDCGEPPFELCYDGISNDCDALADSADPDCNCGDGTCTPGEDACHCPADCGTPPESETNCSDGLDNDCDGYTDYYDSDCGTIPGDVNYDGDVDLEDFQSFQMCWSRSASACLEYFDLDDDGDLDLDDFSIFESNFTGPR